MNILTQKEKKELNALIGASVTYLGHNYEKVPIGTKGVISDIDSLGQPVVDFGEGLKDIVLNPDTDVFVIDGGDNNIAFNFI